MPADLVTRLILKNDKFERDLKASKKQLEFFNTGIKTASASVRSFVGGFAGMAGISYAFMDVVQKSMQFEKSLSSLRSLTGLSAQDMEYFKQKAIELGSTSTQTASQVVEAFQLIGSQQPELLKNKEALTEVTKQAIILAEAAGMDVPAAAKALSGSINQMGESANVASEYINILAAASQAGSADIQYLAKAIEKSGGAASSVGVEYNELVAAIEAIAPKITEASEAGTNLRNIFLTLESSSNKNLKPSVVGLSKAIENLAAKNLDATQMTKMFGKESVTAALAIVNAKDDYKKYLEAITGTNTALEQQKINNDNLAGAVNALSSSWEGFVLTLNKSNFILKDILNFTAGALNRFTDFLKSDEQKQQEVIASGVEKMREELKKDIKVWQNYGYTKAEAISKAKEALSNYYGLDEQSGLKTEEQKLKSLQSQYDELNKGIKKLKVNPVKGLMATSTLGVALNMSGLANNALEKYNIDLAAEQRKIKEQLDTQKAVVNEIRKKEALYKQSIQYLDDELSTTKKIKEASKPENTREPGNIETPVRIGSEKYIEKQISLLNEKISKEINPDIKFDLLRQEDNLKKQLEKIRKENQLTVDLVFRLKELETPADISASIGGINPYDKMKDYTSQLNKIAQGNIERVAESYRKLNQEQENVRIGISSIGSTMQSLSGIMDNNAASWFAWMGNMTSSISNVLPLMRTLVKANEATALTGAAASASSTPVIGWIQAISAVASIGALLANIPKFEQGGIVPGYNFSGDNMLARVNSGEMILNKRQQSRLFDILNEENQKTQKIEVVGRLVGEGSNLVGVIDRYNKKQSRIR